jgi:uncharacterized protein (DUF934 family)
MGIIVTDNGFADDALAIAEADGAFRMFTIEELREADAATLPDRIGLSIGNDIDAEIIASWFDRVDVIAIAFPSFADGRGFSVARQLRQIGYRGTIRATGRLIADQYAHARRVGFDEVAISEDIAARQPEDQWITRAGWRDHFYQKRLLGTR